MLRYASHPMTLPAAIAEQVEVIAAYARREELDFHPTVFEMLSAEQMAQMAAYGGFPQRYPHWRFGMAYEKLPFPQFDLGFDPETERERTIDFTMVSDTINTAFTDFATRVKFQTVLHALGVPRAP